MVLNVEPRGFVPASLDTGEWQAIEPLVDDLRGRELDDTDAVARFLADLNELVAVLDETATRRQIAHSCRTDDEAIESAYLDWERHVRPHLKHAFFDLQKKYLASPLRAELEAEDPRLAMLGKQWRAEVDAFHPDNVPIELEVTELASRYGKLCAAMTVEFDGGTRTLQQMARYLDDPDRSVREQAYRLVQSRRQADRETIDEIFDQLLQRRSKLAANVGLPDYRALKWLRGKRFDYTPEDCHAFAEAVEAEVTPLLESIQRRRRETMGLDRLRPWDLSVDPRGRPPLRPFPAEDVEALTLGARRIFDRIHPRLGEQFSRLRLGEHLDLDSRPAKRPGGFQASLEVAKQPFIFMNAAGVQDDIETLLHEGGHAFHFFAAADEPLLDLRHAPLEFCEVASMSMELLGGDKFDAFYADAERAARAERAMLEGTVRVLPWIATIDQFQHWLYTHPGHGRDQRTAQWRTLLDRFGGTEIDFGDMDHAKDFLWQRQLHLFHYPFYYIEYGFAQVGALQVWANYSDDPHGTVDRLTEAFALGGTRSLPELFEAAGATFRFDRDSLAPIVAKLADRLDALPE